MDELLKLLHWVVDRVEAHPSDREAAHAAVDALAAQDAPADPEPPAELAEPEPAHEDQAADAAPGEAVPVEPAQEGGNPA